MSNVVLRKNFRGGSFIKHDNFTCMRYKLCVHIGALINFYGGECGCYLYLLEASFPSFRPSARKFILNHCILALAYSPAYTLHYTMLNHSLTKR